MPNITQELLPIVIQENNVLVDALLLHRKLKSKGRFYDWLKYRIQEYGFEENRDYFATKKVQSKQGGHNRIDYLLTVDMAKELAMLERNEVGRQIRRFFIAKEKELRGISQLPKEAALFKGVKARRINDREMYPYAEIRQRSGYSTRSSSSGHRNRYWMHFVKEGSMLYVTKEFALHLYHSRLVYNNRAVMVNSQPVLPFNFGDASMLNLGKGGGHA